MFKTLPDGVEIYFAWPSRTARIVPNKVVRKGIELRDMAGRAWVGLASLTALLEKSNLERSPIALAILVIGIVSIVDRWRYLSKLKTLPLELVRTKKNDAHPPKREDGSEIPKLVQLTSKEIDRAYIRDYDRAWGAGLIAGSVLITLGSLWLLFTELPLIFSLWLTFSGLAIGYVGFCILAGKRSRQSGVRRKA